MTGIKRMDIAEFQRLGFLQEVNRQFLHPLGLALEVVTDDDDTKRLGGVWDFRDDPEGMVFYVPTDRLPDFTEKALTVEGERLKHVPARVALFGTVVQPIAEYDQ